VDTTGQKETHNMPEYEIIIESMTPCGGSKYANRTIIEAEAESPEAYVEQHKRFPLTATWSSPQATKAAISTATPSRNNAGRISAHENARCAYPVFFTSLIIGVDFSSVLAILCGSIFAYKR